MGIQTVAAMKAALAKASMPWRLNWTNLKTIEPNAVEALCKVFADWSEKPVQLRFMGDVHLHQILQKATPSGDNTTLQSWWQLRLEALRVTHRPDEFELTALDFCVTYEMSPPAWEVARCEYKSIDSQGEAMFGNTIIGDAYRDSMQSSYSAFDGDSHMDALSSQMSSLLSVELSGQIEGDAIVILDKLVVGDTFSLNYEQKKYVYQVTTVKVVEPTDLSVLAQTVEPTMTIITCTPPGTSWKRLIVQAKQISPVPGATTVAVAPAPAPTARASLPSNAPSFTDQLKAAWNSVFGKK